MAFISEPFKIDDRNLDCNIWHEKHIIRHDIARVGQTEKYRHTITLERKTEKNEDSNVATGMNYGFASFSSWSKSTCNSEMDITYKN